MLDLLTQYQSYVPALSGGVSLERLTGMAIDAFHTELANVRPRLRHLGNDSIDLLIAFGKARVSLTIAQVFDQQQDAIGLIMEWSDITEQWLNDALLQGLDSQQLRADFDADGCFLQANQNFAHRLEKQLAALSGKPLHL